MSYLKHKINPDGTITVREKVDGKTYGYIIPPNQPVEKHKTEIESDPNFEKYRTQENADAYETKLKELEPTAEELAEQEERRFLQEKRKKALDRLIEKEIKKMEKDER